MNPAILTITLLLVTFAPCFATSPTPEAITEFSAQVSNSVKNKNFDSIQSLHDFSRTPKALVERTMMIWKARVTQPDDPNWTFTGTEYFPLNEFLARPGIDKSTVEAYIGEQTVNGIINVPSAPVIGLLAVKFTSGPGGNDFLYPVCLSPAGKLRFVGRMPKDSE